MKVETEIFHLQYDIWVVDSGRPSEPCIKWGHWITHEKGLFWGSCIRHTLSNGRVYQSAHAVHNALGAAGGGVCSLCVCTTGPV